ncbi:tigger transposable element-derived protein 4 [Trichonephila clavipes]|nr:tigger transposable element-derived protein 4 [Trichonephila clavipes]
MALKFGFPPSNLSTIIRNRDKLRNYDSLNSCSKRRRTCVPEDFDEAVMKWIYTLQDKNVPISEPFVIEKAFPFDKPNPVSQKAYDRINAKIADISEALANASMKKAAAEEKIIDRTVNSVVVNSDGGPGRPVGILHLLESVH